PLSRRLLLAHTPTVSLTPVLTRPPARGGHVPAFLYAVAGPLPHAHARSLPPALIHARPVRSPGLVHGTPSRLSTHVRLLASSRSLWETHAFAPGRLDSDTVAVLHSLALARGVTLSSACARALTGSTTPSRSPLARPTACLSSTARHSFTHTRPALSPVLSLLRVHRLARPRPSIFSPSPAASRSPRHAHALSLARPLRLARHSLGRLPVSRPPRHSFTHTRPALSPVLSLLRVHRLAHPRPSIFSRSPAESRATSLTRPTLRLWPAAYRSFTRSLPLSRAGHGPARTHPC
ncbi:hypothetical protein FRC10_000571, partial [Ceratobasidium sp. 414]